MQHIDIERREADYAKVIARLMKSAEAILEVRMLIQKEDIHNE